MDELFFEIINAALRLDTAKVRNLIEFLAVRLEESGDVNTARWLRRALEEKNDSTLHPMESNDVLYCTTPNVNTLTTTRFDNS